MQAQTTNGRKNGENGSFHTAFPARSRKNSNFWSNSSCQRRKMPLYWLMDGQIAKTASGEQGPGAGCRQNRGL